MNKKLLVPLEKVENQIMFIRGHKVIVDADLAFFYGVTTKALNQAIRCNKDRILETPVPIESEQKNMDDPRSCQRALVSPIRRSAKWFCRQTF